MLGHSISNDCFNGAAPVEGRKGCRFESGRGQLNRLQWGRPCGGAERRHPEIGSRITDGFNGAAPVEGRKAGRSLGGVTGNFSFNGAAPVEGRKVPEPVSR